MSISKNHNKGIVILATGGTGGHIFCAQAVAESIQDLLKPIMILDKRGEGLAENINIQKKIIASTPLSKNIFLLAKTLLFIFLETIRLLFFFFKVKPKLIIGFGSYAAFCPLLAAVILRIPIVLYEQNLVIGKTNKIFSSFSKRILFSIDKDPNLKVDQNKLCLVYPAIRNQIHKANKSKRQKSDEKQLNILVIGGSAGAKVFSTIIPLAIKELKNEQIDVSNFLITHQCPEKDIPALNDLYSSIGIASYNVTNFLENMGLSYKNADLVIARAGSGTITEIIHMEKAAILIPFPHSADAHQTKNATYLQNLGLCWQINQTNSPKKDASALANIFKTIIQNPNIIKEKETNLKEYKAKKRLYIQEVIMQIL